MAISTGDAVTIEYTGRLEDGTVFDTSRESVATEAGLDGVESREFAPLTVDVGAGQIIDGLEEALVGLEPGDEETVTIPPEKAYGERDEDRLFRYDAGQFMEMLGGSGPKEGMVVETDDGLAGEVVDVDHGDGVVTVDFNHELAGKTLEFEVEVVDVR